MKRTVMGIAIIGLAVVLGGGSGCMSPKGETPPTRVTEYLNSGHDCLSLTNLQPVTVTVGAGKYSVNNGDAGASTNIKPIIEASICKEYLYAHAPSALEFEIPAGYGHFFAVGYSLAPNNRSMRYLVKCDNQVVFVSEPLSSYPTGYVVVDCQIPSDSKKLVLVVDQLEDNRWDWSTWCYPRFYK